MNEPVKKDRGARANSGDRKRIIAGKMSYNENTLQREIVLYINERSGLGCRVSRIKNQGTWDPRLKCFRANGTEKGIPDIIGATKEGQAIFIEVKLNRNARISNEQMAYMVSMAKLGALCGFAYTLRDAFDIIVDNPTLYPRMGHTFGPNRILAQGTKHEKKADGEKRADHGDTEDGIESEF